MPQTSITQYSAPAFAGMMYGVESHDISSFAAEEITPIAYPVMRGTNPEKQVKKATTGAAAFGFALQDHTMIQNGGGSVSYAAKETVSVLRKGWFWVNTSDAVVAGTVANLTTATGYLTDAAVTTGIEAFTKISVTFETSTTAAGLALVSVK